MVNLHGGQLIGGEQSSEGTQHFQAFDPNANLAFETKFYEATVNEVDRALSLAHAAHLEFAATNFEARATFLERIAGRIEQSRDDLIELCVGETAYPQMRVLGEFHRTVEQTRMFAKMLREGSWVDAKIDRGQAERKPVRKPDIRSMLHSLGPVVVFGASNFPLAISVAGTDTTTAFAAGCPVVVKAHPAHPGTCEFIGQIICELIRELSLPPGVFSLLQGGEHELGVSLVTHELTAAVAFTGSLSGGRALHDIAKSRPRPIPFYAEMGSVNPVVVMPKAIEKSCHEIATGFVHSVNLGVGQFCTSPGMLLVPKSELGDRLIDTVKKQVETASNGVMLSRGIHDAYLERLDVLRHDKSVTLYNDLEGQSIRGGNEVPCVIAVVDATTLDQNSVAMQELFGPCSILVRCDGMGEIIRVIEFLGGQLTATVHGTDEDLATCHELLDCLRQKVGRLVFNGFPTGVEVCHAMHHGGPFPAASDPHFTSIGTDAIKRFVRPVCYQDSPQWMLPVELQDENQRGILRLVDGVYTRDAI
ncbi:MAG: aldehyde dehydrogenase (NADP(+)) [Rubripirellula sp.]|nr:aldehyde dehydrogenase (NADP(+)) [Rubripirellula sp.]